uniref:Mariner Mos1 transposase n=1 Tax=Steinernema glaseri TaxID=37863 RepID=A0A1I7YDW0_9BILA
MTNKTTLTAAVNTEQLQKLADAIKEKRPHMTDVILQHDNARPHVANLTRTKLEELGWEVLAHPSYSPDLAPSDYHLFRSMSNELAGVHFDSDEAVENWIQKFFGSQPAISYERGIHLLPDKWREAVESKGAYMIS